MGISLQCNSYADFQSVVASLPSKIQNVYYNYTSGNGFSVMAVTFDMQTMVGAHPVPIVTVPASFLTDYPNAIQLPDTAVNGGVFSIV